MAGTQGMQPRIVTVKRTGFPINARVDKLPQQALYEFYIHLGDAPRKAESAQGGVVVSVKRIPKIFSEIGGLNDAQYKDCWIRFGYIEYYLLGIQDGIEAMALRYYPKNMEGFRQVKRLGYYLDSISTSDLMRENGVTVISTSPSANPNRGNQLLKVGLNTSVLQDSTWNVREYLLGMGRGIMQKVEMARKAELVLQ